MANMTFKTNLLPDNTGGQKELGSTTAKWAINGVTNPELTDEKVNQTQINEGSYNILMQGTSGGTYYSSGVTIDSAIQRLNADSCCCTTNFLIAANGTFYPVIDHYPSSSSNNDDNIYINAAAGDLVLGEAKNGPTTWTNNIVIKKPLILNDKLILNNNLYANQLPNTTNATEGQLFFLIIQ